MDEDGSGSRIADELRAAREELDEAVRQIRLLPGYERFLDPPGEAEALSASREQPLIYLAATLTAGLALCVVESRRIAIRLPSLTESALSEVAARYHDAYRGWRQNPSTGLARWRGTIDDTCRWLWTAAVGPVIDAVPLKRVTFVACGQLGLLPLHAAWQPA